MPHKDGHYAWCKIEPLTYAMENDLDPCQAKVIKYITRFRHKNGLEDLLKCRDMVEWLIKYEYGEEGCPTSNKFAGSKFIDLAKT